MKMNQILVTIRTLACSQGSYGRLYRALMDMRDNEPERYQGVVAELEGQNFGDAVDMVMYFEC